MLMSFLDNLIEVGKWDTKPELLDALSGCSEGSLLLGEDSEYPKAFYSATVWIGTLRAGLRQFGVGICEEIGLRPHLLALPDAGLLIFGFNDETVGVSLQEKRELFRLSLGTPFRSFASLPDADMILVFSEIGVVAVTKHGQELWRYDEDIIEECVIDGDTLRFKFMDSPPASIGLLDGRPR